MFGIALALENLGLYIYREYQVLATEGREKGDVLCLCTEHGGQGGDGTEEKHLPISEEGWQAMYVTYMKKTTELLYLEKWK